MKILIMLVLLVFGSAAHAAIDNHEELFSPEQNIKIVKAIDYICGDIWCEGYYDYKFDSISCDKNNQDCDLKFQFKEEYNNNIVYSPMQVCHIDGVSAFNQVMEDEQYLQFGFIDKLNECFEELAEQYRGH